MTEKHADRLAGKVARPLFLAAFAVTTAALAIALAKSLRDARTAWKAAAENYAEAILWMDDSSQQALIIARMNEGDFGEIFERESVH